MRTPMPAPGPRLLSRLALACALAVALGYLPHQIYGRTGLPRLIELRRSLADPHRRSAAARAQQARPRAPAAARQGRPRGGGGGGAGGGGGGKEGCCDLSVPAGGRGRGGGGAAPAVSTRWERALYRLRRTLAASVGLLIALGLAGLDARGFFGDLRA